MRAVIILSISILSFLCQDVCASDVKMDKNNLVKISEDSSIVLSETPVKDTLSSRVMDSVVNIERDKMEKAIREENYYVYLAIAGEIAQTYLQNDKYDSAYVYLDKCYTLWQKHGSDINLKNLRPVYMMYNSLAIYSANANLDYEKATEYILEGLKIAREHPDDSDYAVMGQNLVTIFYIRQNPAGLKYAQEIFHDGESRNDKYLKYIGAYGSALMYSLQEEYDSAYNYVNYASKVLGEERTLTLNNLYADILYGKGKVDSAEFYYKKAISQVETAAVSDIAYLYLSYGSFLRKQGRLKMSEQILQAGLDSAVNNKNRIFSYRLYEELSKVYSDMGDADKSLEYYKKFVSESESVFSIKRERAINELTFKYESERHLNELNRHQMMLLKKKHQLHIMIFIFILVGIISLIIFIMYRNKSRMYTRIVRQYKNAIESENKLKSEITELHKKLADTEREDNSDSKDEDIFLKLESLMKEKFLYRDSSLTREKLAEIIGTNRTYLSRIVNEQSGMQYNQYINSYRIKEALTVLSNPSNDIPLKALSAEIGFSSITTFYKAFQDEVGMTPARYRKKIQELSDTD